jgi:DNA-binding XRE family transcriptional regulator
MLFFKAIRVQTPKIKRGVHTKFQKKLVKLRKEHGLSQAGLGERVGVHIAHLSRLENGKPQPSVDLGDS